MSAGALARAVRGRDPVAIASALNLIEDVRPQVRTEMGDLLQELRDDAGAGHRIGLTGPPGVGKSTLAGSLARELRARDRTVAVLAIDPTSQRSGGSLLGDRTRMDLDPNDPGLFMRSLATGGQRGGLSLSSHAATTVLASAFEVVVVETTGVGQSETDVRHVTDTVVLVVQPGSGDTLQFLKAGVMEIPDLLVVNKADHEALAERASNDLRGALSALETVGGDPVPVVATSMERPESVRSMLDHLDAHRATLADSVSASRRKGEVEWTLRLFRRLHGQHGVQTLGGETELRRSIQQDLDTDVPPRICARLSETFRSS